MNTIGEIQDKIIADFYNIGDSFDQYTYLMELGCTLSPMPDIYRTDENLVQGCQSRVWLKAISERGLFYFTADSDTLIIKGILYILQQLFCGQSPHDVASADITFMKETAITETFNDTRQKGIGYIINALKKCANLMAENQI